MAGRTQAEAVHAFLEPLSRSVSCITRTPLNVGGGYHQADSPHVLMIGDGSPLSLRARAGPLALTISQRYRIVEHEGERGPWKVQTAGYLYDIDDADGREIIAFHWHPDGASSVTTPHLHLGAGAEVGRTELTDDHLPSGRVAIEQVLRLLIEAFGVEPERDDWRKVLDTSQAAYEQWRTWAR